MWTIMTQNPKINQSSSATHHQLNEHVRVLYQIGPYDTDLQAVATSERATSKKDGKSLPNKWTRCLVHPTLRV